MAGAAISRHWGGAIARAFIGRRRRRRRHQAACSVHLGESRKCPAQEIALIIAAGGSSPASSRCAREMACRRGIRDVARGIGAARGFRPPAALAARIMKKRHHRRHARGGMIHWPRADVNNRPGAPYSISQVDNRHDGTRCSPLFRPRPSSWHQYRHAESAPPRWLSPVWRLTRRLIDKDVPITSPFFSSLRC